VSINFRFRVFWFFYCDSLAIPQQERAFEQIALFVKADDKRDFWHRCAPEGAIMIVG
jgi:hypothetical protein